MTNEDGIDLEEFMDGSEEESQDVTETEDSHDSTDDVEVPSDDQGVSESDASDAEADTSNTSVVDMIAPKKEKKESSGFVPLDEHKKLRKRAQKAEQELEGLRKEATLGGAGNPLDIDDEELLTGADARALAEKIKAETKQELELEARKIAEAAKLENVKSLEVEARSKHDNFDEVMSKLSMISLNDTVLAKIANSDNPAEEAYNVGCQLFNIQKQDHKEQVVDETKQETEQEDNDLSDDDLMKELFG